MGGHFKNYPKHGFEIDGFSDDPNILTEINQKLAPTKQAYIKMEEDSVNHPAHYTSHPSGIECIQITEHMGFNLGNAVKYIWRADLKGDAIEDLKKAEWYIKREIAKRESGK